MTYSNPYEGGLDNAILSRLDSYLDEEGLAAVWFARPNGFAWLTGGNNAVDRTADRGVAAAGYNGDDVTVIADSIEAGRLADEELPESVAVESFPWHEATLYLREDIRPHGGSKLLTGV